MHGGSGLQPWIYSSGILWRFLPCLFARLLFLPISPSLVRVALFSGLYVLWGALPIPLTRIALRLSRLWSCWRIGSYRSFLDTPGVLHQTKEVCSGTLSMCDIYVWKAYLTPLGTWEKGSGKNDARIFSALPVRHELVACPLACVKELFANESLK